MNFPLWIDIGGLWTWPVRRLDFDPDNVRRGAQRDFRIKVGPAGNHRKMMENEELINNSGD